MDASKLVLAKGDEVMRRSMARYADVVLGVTHAGSPDTIPGGVVDTGMTSADRGPT